MCESCADNCAPISLLLFCPFSVSGALRALLCLSNYLEQALPRPETVPADHARVMYLRSGELLARAGVACRISLAHDVAIREPEVPVDTVTVLQVGRQCLKPET